MKINREIYTLKNKMKILLISSDTTYSVTISASIKSGSALETKKTQGLTHFIEHLSILSAKKKWPNKENLNKLLEFKGADYNASTSKEELQYYINIPYKELEFGIEFIKEVLYNSTYSDDIVEKERKVILDEISKDEDNPYSRNNKLISETLTTKNSGYVLNTAGQRKTVSNFTKDQLLKHYKEVHAPEKVLITIAGKFNLNSAKELIERYFNNINYKSNKYELPKDPLKKAVITSKKSPKTDLILTTLVFPSNVSKHISNKDIAIIRFILNVLCGPLSSRLIKSLRFDNGLLYHIGAQDIIYDKFGSIIIYYDIEPTHFKQSLTQTLKELHKFITKGISDKELIHYKEYVINRNLVTFDNIHNYSKLIKGAVFNNRQILTLEEINNIFRNLEKEEVNKAIKKYLKLPDLNIFAYGNIKKDTKVTIRNLINTFR